MKYFIDCEFLEDGKTIDLISIAVVAEDGCEYFAVSREFDRNRAEANPWLAKNVLPYLPPRNDYWKLRIQIAAELVKFVGESPEFWGDYASYDWVALCQLYGRMIDLPKGWPMFIKDVQQLKVDAGIKEFKYSNPQEHNAIFDAIECQERYLECVGKLNECRQ